MTVLIVILLIIIARYLFIIANKEEIEKERKYLQTQKELDEFVKWMNEEKEKNKEG